MPIVTVIMCDSWVLPNVIIFRKRAALVPRPSLFGVLQKELCDLDIKEDNSQDKCTIFVNLFYLFVSWMAVDYTLY